MKVVDLSAITQRHASSVCVGGINLEIEPPRPRSHPRNKDSPGTDFYPKLHCRTPY